MRFKADEIVSVLQTEINQYRSRLEAREVGRVLEVGDGIARVYGLSGVMAGEMVEFTQLRGLAFNLEENSVGVIVWAVRIEISEGIEVERWRASPRAGRRRDDRPRCQSARCSPRWQGRNRHGEIAAGRINSSRRSCSPTNQSAVANEHQGYRCGS